MSGAFRALPSSDLTHAVEGLLLPSLAEALRDRGPGHCMRVSDLGPELMIALARGLRSQVPSASVHVLADGEAPSGEDLHVSSTKLVELRNPLPDGSLRPPLCVFLPANVRTSAEDSFGSATFEDFRVDDAYERLRRKLLERVPSTLRGYARDLLAHLGEQRWGWADGMAQVRYLLCVRANGNDGESFGGALYELGLVPDFKLFDDPATAFGRVRKNLECVRRLTHGDSSVLGRVLDLDLVNQGLRRRLSEYLAEAGLEDPSAWTRDVVLSRRNWDLSFDKWEFGSGIAPDRIAFVRVETDLPVVPDDGEGDERLVDLIGQQVLAPRERRTLGVVVEVAPPPAPDPGAGPLHGPDPLPGHRTRRCVPQAQGLEAGEDTREGHVLQARPDRFRGRLAPRARPALDLGRGPPPHRGALRAERKALERERTVLRPVRDRSR